jgi:hypothetical protein
MSGMALSEERWVAELCPHCGLCCNGVLFGDVELQRGDDPKQLTAAGLNLFRKGRKHSFNQPCGCFDGNWCRIYYNRPQRCRTFECRLLQQLQAGRITLPLALRSIAEARRLSNQVRDMVRELGHTDDSAPLNRRYAALVAEPIDLSADEQRLERRSELMLAVGRLVKLLERDFLA